MSRNASDYFGWLQTVPEEQRIAVAEVIARIELKSSKDLVTLSQQMIVAVLKGTVAPDIAAEARKWAELMLAAYTVTEAARTGANMSVSFTALLSSTAKEVHEAMNPLQIGLDVFKEAEERAGNKYDNADVIDADDDNDKEQAS